MSLSFARVSVQALKSIQQQADLLDALFFEVDSSKTTALGIKPEHCCEIDFLSLSMAYSAMAEDMGEEEPDEVLVEDLDPTGVIDFEAGYGPGFYLDPPAMKEALETSMIPHMDDDAHRVLTEAVSNGEALVGIIS